MTRNFIKTNIFAVLSLVLLCPAVRAQNLKYPTLSENKLVIQGDDGKWDSLRVHTLSVVKANKDGFKYWGYYGLAYYAIFGGLDTSALKAGLVRSNDLVHWQKYNGNPIIESNCRWPTAVISRRKTYLFYAQYDHVTNDSRIVMLSSKDGIHFGNMDVIVPMHRGMQNQNPFIYYDSRDKSYYLFYYSGIEKSKDSTSDNWNIMFKKASSPEGLAAAHPTILISSEHTMAAPSIAYTGNNYYLLVEEWNPPVWGKLWVTSAYESKKIDGTYKITTNSPVLTNNDACAFEYVFDKQLYVFYSHCYDSTRDAWDLRMVKATR